MSDSPIKLPVGVRLKSALGPVRRSRTRTWADLAATAGQHNAPGVLARAWASLLSFVRGL